MSIRRTDGSPSIPTPAKTGAASTPATQQTDRAAGAGAPAAAPRDTLTQAQNLNRAAQLGAAVNQPQNHVATPGPIALDSPAAKNAIQTSVNFLSGQKGLVAGDASKSFAAKSVDRDELGMVHVRLDRVQNGLKVYGEQVISHLDPSGKVVDVTGNEAPANLPAVDKSKIISANKAIDIAKKDFGLKSQSIPASELMYFKANDGQYHAAYKVDLSNFTDGPKPQRMNYFVDANSGKVLGKTNLIDGIELPRLSDPVTATGSANPNAAIKDLSTTTSTIHIDDDLDITKLTAGVDIAHTYRGDLVVSLTSPSGKTAVISNRQGGSADDLKGNFDLSAFAGESSKGDWKLTVEDKARADTGTLKAWSLNITGTPKTPPPPPPPGDVVTATGSASPKAPIQDFKTTTSTIDIADDISVDQLKFNVDANHTYRGDLVATLTSPSGKTVTLLNREGGSADNWKGTFDLSQFAGEKAKGQWKLSIEDKAGQDTGTLNSWGLEIKGHKEGNPPPPPPPPPPGGADDTTMYSGKVKIDAKQNADGSWFLQDDSRGKGVVTYDANNKSTATGTTQIKDNNNVWGEATDPARAKAGVDAQYGAQMTYDFYKNVLGRNSIDNAGEKLVNYVHLDNNYNNAYWDGKQMQYGDGDGKTFSPLTSIDVAGHEITHGMTERTAGLIYSGESGGLNEAMSDIMGKGVEWYAAQQNPNVHFTWNIGESIYTPGKPGDALRYMGDPTKDGYSIDNYKNYPKQTEVHGSSGIANNAFYLMVEGGTNKTSGQRVDQGIGMEKALKIMYRAETVYFTPNTTFAQAKQAAIKAATDLYGAGSPEVTATTQAWTAVGL